MAGKSIYEGANVARQAQNNVICFGRVHKVDPERRMCTVKTFFGTHPSVNDAYINNCQWLNMAANPDGDESTSIPRAGAMGMIIFVQGEPFIFGFFKGLNKKGQALTGKEKAKLTEGDTIFSTKAGNYILVKANGSIEIKSKETLRTLYYPTKSLLQHLVRNYEMKADGGTIDWKSDKDGSTKHSATFRRDIANSFIVLEERGACGGLTMYRTLVGPGIGGGGVSVYKHEVDLTGESRLTIGPPGVEAFKCVIDATGKVSVETALDVDVKSLLGNITVNAVAKNVNVLADLGNIDVKATAGDVTMEGSLGKMKLAKGMAGIGGPTAELFDLFDQFIDVTKTVFDTLALETHLFLGYPTTPPNQAALYKQASVLATAIKTLLGTIKGGV